MDTDRRFGREIVMFAVIGVISTAVYAVLYFGLRSFTGPVAANALALILTAIGNTAANRRVTFGVRGRASMIRDQVGGLLALGFALAITTVAIDLLAVLAPNASLLVELAVLVVANALATVVRFVLLRTWIVGDAQRLLSPVGTTDRHRSHS